LKDQLEKLQNENEQADEVKKEKNRRKEENQA
jgi:hypothetical protein